MKHTNIIAALLVAAILPGHAASDIVNPLTYTGSSQDGFVPNASAVQPTFLAASGLGAGEHAGGSNPDEKTRACA